jgi:hypothetical protein
MQLIFFVILSASILWTGFVLFANMMKPADTGGFVGGETLFWAWLVTAIFAAAMWWK